MMNQQDLFVLLCMALRYALSRNDGSNVYLMTFERLVLNYGSLLNPEQRKQIIGEIGEKVQAAMHCDVFGSIEVQKGWEAIAGRLASMGADPTYPNFDEVRLMKAGRLIDAIRSLRQRTNLGLREAKDVTDMWRANESKYGLL